MTKRKSIIGQRGVRKTASKGGHQKNRLTKKERKELADNRYRARNKDEKREEKDRRKTRRDKKKCRKREKKRKKKKIRKKV